MIVYDAHAHMGDPQELALRKSLQLHTMFSCGNPQQAADTLALCAGDDAFSLTAGVHPWYADRVSLSDMEPFMHECSLVGEIGLDSVWCTVPMDAQRRIFSAQLDWAAANGKGIVLHTKGCETEIAQRIQGFPHPVLVHWYSGPLDALYVFLERDCYFTVGPDVARNPAVQAVAKLVPDNRILFETDGMDAIRWACGDLPLAQLPHVLESSVRTASKLRSQSPETLAEYANGNFQRLV